VRGVEVKGLRPLVRDGLRTLTIRPQKVQRTNTMTSKTSSAAKPSSPKLCPPIRGEYNGRPTITLRRSEDDKYPFSFGAAKARLIIAHIEDIKKFAAEQPAQ
jgi:hypothetical protein